MNEFGAKALTRGFGPYAGHMDDASMVGLMGRVTGTVGPGLVGEVIVRVQAAPSISRVPGRREGADRVRHGGDGGRVPAAAHGVRIGRVRQLTARLCALRPR